MIMKKILILLISVISIQYVQAQAQDFGKMASDARTAYAAGKLEDARFAMQQMLQEIDLAVGKEILKLLPTKMADTAAANTTKDNVTAASGFIGVTIHREYGKGGFDTKTINLDVITNSPMITSINAILSLPFIGAGGDQKIVKVNGYKALIQKNSDNGVDNYDLQLPLNNTLITLKAPGFTQDQVIKLASTIPVSDIAKLVQ
jgi:hypothetical protein